MSKMKKIVSNSLESCVKPKFIFDLAKPSYYFNKKDRVLAKYIDFVYNDLVYNCTQRQIDRNESYIGETKIRFEERIIDLSKRNNKSHILKHNSENSDHLLVRQFSNSWWKLW